MANTGAASCTSGPPARFDAEAHIPPTAVEIWRYGHATQASYSGVDRRHRPRLFYAPHGTVSGPGEKHGESLATARQLLSCPWRLTGRRLPAQYQSRRAGLLDVRVCLSVPRYAQ